MKKKEKEFLELLASHDVPGSYVIIVNSKKNGIKTHRFSFLCPCDEKDVHNIGGLDFPGYVRRSTLSSLLSYGFELKSFSKYSTMNMREDIWTFTKPLLCPGCSGHYVEC